MVNIDGRELKERKLIELKSKLENLDKQLGLAVLQVGDDEASKVYIRQKENAANSLGYTYVHKHFAGDVTQEEVIKEIELLNNNDGIDGIIVQMPLPKHLNESEIQNTINPLKDVDGLTYVNSGRLVQNVPGLVPCTPKGIIDILDN